MGNCTHLAFDQGLGRLILFAAFCDQVVFFCQLAPVHSWHSAGRLGGALGPWMLPGPRRSEGAACEFLRRDIPMGTHKVIFSSMISCSARCELSRQPQPLQGVSRGRLFAVPFCCAPGRSAQCVFCTFYDCRNATRRRSVHSLESRVLV